MSYLVVVESPAKAKTINKYLGKDYKVVASYGHVRDLVAKDGAVKPDEDFSMSWDLDAESKKKIKGIEEELRNADHLILATDPDREGEAISWHIHDVLTSMKKLTGKEVSRVVFNEITKNAILEALKHPRQIDNNLVEAYLARRALDYLVGFTLSPVLWRKLPGSRSAGRVQSVALRLICERESEIELFKSDEYWQVEVTLLTPDKEEITARLTHLNGEKLEKLSLGNEGAAEKAVALIKDSDFILSDAEEKLSKRHPAAPFRTSTLQQEASRKLGFGASRTMRIAQKLYEGVDIGGETTGLITYMRTDSTHLAGEAIARIRGFIEKNYAKDYLPDSPRQYKGKAKGAQEAHEAIRPTDIMRRPEQLAKYLNEDELKLYTLIWKRSLACQMSSAQMKQVALTFDDQKGQKAVLRASGSQIIFDGFLTLYQEGQDDVEEDNDEGRILPHINKGDPAAQKDILPTQHFTQPPPRYTEASLVKKLEELGIGRPSTYASIIQVLQAREYVVLEQKRFIPSDRGRIVTAFLANYFSHYVEYDFTANMEEKLDDISEGKLAWKKVLTEFWTDFKANVDESMNLKVSDVIDQLNDDLAHHFFPDEEGTEKGSGRKCPSCDDGLQTIKTGKFGAFIGCSNYPECQYTRRLRLINREDEHPIEEELRMKPKELGVDPKSGQMITLRKGPYGPYIQLGEEEGKGKNKTKPKRLSIPKGYNLEDIDLEIAKGLLVLPREVGIHPESGEMITAGIGRFGPYLKHGPNYKSLKDDDVLTIGLNRAVVVLGDLNELGKRKRAAKAKDGDTKTKGKAKSKTTKKATKKKAAPKKETTSKTTKTTAKKKPASKKSES